MMSIFQVKQISILDDEVARLRSAQLSFTQADVLQTKIWSMGEDVLFREDFRFRQTPWNRWILYDHILANELLYQYFHDVPYPEVSISDALKAISGGDGYTYVFCPGDSRFVLNGSQLRLAAGELSAKPMIQEELSEYDKYQTHLPVTTLEAAAASEPSGEWGPKALESRVEQLGWMRIDLPGRKLNDRMFVAKIKGQSMDNGYNGITNGTYAVFELWPVGTRQNKVVLVRGAFSDPETGSYAVKKYTADVRDEEGRHNRVTLISLNQDKKRYPDIEILPEQDDDITIVAQLISPLGYDQFAKQPKTRCKPGRRDLTSKQGWIKIKKRLASISESFFSTEQICAGKKSKLQEDEWNSKFICLDYNSGGLQIETSSLMGLPSFVKKLTVCSGKNKQPVLAFNLRHHRWRIPVKPSEFDYIWSAPDHEDLIDEDLNSIKLSGIKRDELMVFRVDAVGVGHLMAGKKLTAGYRYRLIFAGNDLSVVSPLGEVHTYPNEWLLWEFEMPVALTIDQRSIFDLMGLGISKQVPVLLWGQQVPIAYKENFRGVSYACFSSDALPVLIIQGLTTALDGELKIFIYSGKDLVSKELPMGSEWYLALNDLKPGNYVVEVAHEKNRFGLARMAFCIEAKPIKLISAKCWISLDDKIIEIEEKTRFSNIDLKKIIDESQNLQIIAPPLWSVSHQWCDEIPRGLNSLVADQNGYMELDDILKGVSRFYEQPVGDYVLDFKELGELTVQHQRQLSQGELFSKFQLIVRERHDMLNGMQGQFEAIKTLWLEPILSCMNYSIENLLIEDFEIPKGLTVLLLNTLKRKKNKVVKQKQKILILLTKNSKNGLEITDEIQKFVNELCDDTDLETAIITDGFTWTLHKAHSRLTVKSKNIVDIILGIDKEGFDQFLFYFSVGV